MLHVITARMLLLRSAHTLLYSVEKSSDRAVQAQHFAEHDANECSTVQLC
jgi:hypothetical protein